METILDILKYASQNLKEGQCDTAIGVGRRQLNRSITLLDKGFSIEDNYDLALNKSKGVQKIKQ